MGKVKWNRKLDALMMEYEAVKAELSTRIANACLIGDLPGAWIFRGKSTI